MKTFASVATLAVLLSSASATKVTLEELPCLQETELESFSIEANQVVVKNLESVCGLKITAVEGIPSAEVVCHAFKDAKGTISGSSPFTFTNPAIISTNPVQIGALKCDVSLVSSTSSALYTATVTTGFSTGGPNTEMTATVSPDTTVTQATGTISTSIVTGTGGPGAPGNTTVPTGTQPPLTSFTGAAAAAATFGAGVVAAGFAALML